MTEYTQEQLQAVEKVLDVLQGQVVGVDYGEDFANYILHEPFWAIRKHFGL